MNEPAAIREVEAGRELFNAGRYWDAHEAWEGVWLESSGDVKLALQALIQLAAAHYHFDRNNERGAARLVDAARDKLRRSGLDSVLGTDLRSPRAALADRPYSRIAPRLEPARQ